MEEWTDKVRNLIIKGELGDGIKILMENSADLPDEDYNTILNLQARYNTLLNEEINGAVLTDEYYTLRNKLQQDTLKLITERIDVDRHTPGIQRRPLPLEKYRKQINKIREMHSAAIKQYSLYSALIVTVGLGILLFGLFYFDQVSVTKPIVSIGGGIISIFSGFPIKEIIGIKDKIGSLGVLELKLDATQSPEELQKIDGIIWKILEKTA